MTIHKATPRYDYEVLEEATCIHCHEEIKRVPGGHGPTWVHAATGAVAATTLTATWCKGERTAHPEVEGDSSMTFEEFWVQYSRTYQHYTDQRTGQYFFNALHDVRPDLANEIRNTEFDPFYDDLRLPKAAARVCERWTRYAE